MSGMSKFASEHQLIFFVSGRKSSNGKILFDECKRTNSNSFHIEGPQEIDFSLIEGVESIGICGATSTPAWLMARVAKAIEEKF